MHLHRSPRLPKGPVCDVVLRQNDVRLSCCGRFPPLLLTRSASLSVSVCFRVNGTICWWTWSGTTASRRCPTPCTSTWCRIATTRTVRVGSWTLEHIHTMHKNRYLLSPCITTLTHAVGWYESWLWIASQTETRWHHPRQPSQSRGSVLFPG